MIHPATLRRIAFVQRWQHFPIRLDQTDSVADRTLKIRWRGGYDFPRAVDFRRGQSRVSPAQFYELTRRSR